MMLTLDLERGRESVWPCYTSGEVSLQPTVRRATVLRTVAFMSKCFVKP